MEDLAGKAAVITGGGSGIGRALALAFAGEGMNVVVGDVDVAAAEAVRDEVRALGVKALSLRVDVSDRAAMGAFAERVHAEFGSCDLLCNNAGVAIFRSVRDTQDADWDWVLGVDLLGPVYGLQAFLPGMLAKGNGGHIVNTASIAGLYTLGDNFHYATAKFGVVGLSESLRIALEPEGIGVSVLCPARVATAILSSEFHRPERYGPPRESAGTPSASLSVGVGERISADEAARLVVRAVKENQLYIVTHQESRAGVEARFRAIMAAYDWAAEAN